MSKAMDVEEFRRLLIRAKTTRERVDAVRRAVQGGIPLCRVEVLLDWLDQVLAASGTPDRRESSSPGHTTSTPRREDADRGTDPDSSHEADGSAEYL